MADPGAEHVAVEVAGKRGKLVSVEEVHALAVLTGKAPGNATDPADNPATSADGNAGTVAGDAQPQTAAVVVSPASAVQLAAIRDEWLAPLVDRIAELERERGRLEAERDMADPRIEEQRRRADVAEAVRVKTRQQAEAAEREREELRRLAEGLQERHDALRSAAVYTAPPAAPAATHEAAAPDTATGAGDALGPLRRLWRAIRGGPP